MTRGLIDAGGYVIAGIDNDEQCERTYVENNPNRYVDRRPPHFLAYDIFPQTDDYPDGQQGELQDELDGLIDYWRRKVPDAPLLFAICAPCQPFTKLSKKTLSHRRKIVRKRDSSLLREATKFIALFNPMMVLSENVPGIDNPIYGRVWQEFRDSVESLGYATGSKVIDASGFGVPQYRKRSVLIAVRKDSVLEERYADLFMTELLVPDKDPDSPLVTVKEAIAHLPPIKAGESHKDIPNHMTRSLSDLNLKRLSLAKPGESNAYMDDTEFGDLSLLCHRKAQSRWNQRCFNDVYTRMHPDRPAPTITTKSHSISNGRFGHYDITQVRAISLREAAILQSFPDDYVFYPLGQIESVSRMIGNAVPPCLARFFASYLINSIRKEGFF
jgi:DNA (cytosine-5)-methyltransferase 1